jgi:uncharacterized membrane protein
MDFQSNSPNNVNYPNNINNPSNVFESIKKISKQLAFTNFLLLLLVIILGFTAYIYYVTWF